MHIMNGIAIIVLLISSDIIADIGRRDEHIDNSLFLKPDNEKLYYTNSVLATKAIGNYYRSPE